jgi:hypothetical protein
MISRDMMDVSLVKKTMRVLPYEEAKEGIDRFVRDEVGDFDPPTAWDLSFEEYIETHKADKLLFCRYAKGVGMVFSPSDHHGIWGIRREGEMAKGLLPRFVIEVLEQVAKEKGLA